MNNNDRYIEVEPKVKLHVIDRGKGRSIVFIHGLFLSAEIFKNQFNILPQNGFRVIAISLRGFGKSDKPAGKYNYDIYARDVKKVLDALNIEDITLVGFSMGVSVIIRYMALYNQERVSKLVLIGTPAPKWIKNKAHPYGFGLKNLKEILKILFKNFNFVKNLGKTMFVRESLQKSGILFLSRLSFQASVIAGLKSLIQIYKTNLYNDLPKITVPTLIFHGRHDKICPIDLAKILSQKIKNSKLIIFEKSGHGVILEEKNKINTELKNLY